MACRRPSIRPSPARSATTYTSALAMSLTRPALSARGTYCLTCWGGTPRYDRAGWEAAIDSMADAGMNRVMFWMDGLFRSAAPPGRVPQQAGTALRRRQAHQRRHPPA